MRVLLVKMSSMGDVIHSLYAVEDAAQQVPGIEFDWVVEEAFADIPAMHPAVVEVLPISLRRWRRNPRDALASGEPAAFLRRLRDRRYDLVLDGQGLLKSALCARLANGPRVGFDAASAKEGLAAWFYDASIRVSRDQHAIARLRRLFAEALGYACPGSLPVAGLRVEEGRAIAAEGAVSPTAATGRDPTGAAAPPTVVFVHGTTWASKEYPVAYWEELVELAGQAGYRVALPQGSPAELARATQLARNGPHVSVLPAMSLSQIAAYMKSAVGVVTLDSGLGHLADALLLPLVALYGATSPALTGPSGPASQIMVSDNLPCIPCLKRSCRFEGALCGKVQPPCFDETTPRRVWQALQYQIESAVR